MPIRAELRHLYRGKEYKARRARIQFREGNRCKFCRVPNGKEVVRYRHIPGVCYGLQDGVGYKAAVGITGARIRGSEMPEPGRVSRVVLTLAHLDHDPTNNADENLAFLCQACHLRHDQGQHKVNARETRLTRKDAARPLLQEAPLS